MSTGSSRASLDRPELMEALNRVMRDASGQGVIYSQMVAERLGVNSSDLECLDFVVMRGPLTAGELAAATGLTTGAITGVIDRLEREALVRRVRDLHDRRRIVVELVPNAERERALAQLYEPLGRRITELVAQRSASERATLLDFLTQATDVLEAETSSLRRGGE